MRAVRLIIWGALLLLSPQTGMAEGSLVSRVEPDGLLQNRLVLETPDPRHPGYLRGILWLRHDEQWPPTTPEYRLGIETDLFDLGPLALTGGLRELTTPHPLSARPTSWHESTGARLDSGLVPATRTGLALSPGWLPGRLSFFRHSGGRIAVATAGAVLEEGGEPDRLMPEITVAVSRPTVEGSPTSDSIPWFGRTPLPSGMVHLLARQQRRLGTDTRTIFLGSAIAGSASATLAPGWWFRTSARGVRTRSRRRPDSLPSAPQFPTGTGPGDPPAIPVGGSPRETTLDAAGWVSLSSPSYRLFYGDVPSRAASGALSVRAHVDQKFGVAAESHLEMSWMDETMVPGTAFTLRGLRVDEVSLQADLYAATHGWNFDLSAALEVDLTDCDPTALAQFEGPAGNPDRFEGLIAEPVASVGLIRERPPRRAAGEGGGESEDSRTEIPLLPAMRSVGARMAVSYTGPVGFDPATAVETADPQGTADPQETRQTDVVGTWEICFGPVRPESEWSVDLSGSFRICTYAGEMIFDRSGAKCSLTAGSMPKVTAAVELEWSPRESIPVTWGITLGWTARSLRAEE